MFTYFSRCVNPAKMAEMWVCRNTNYFGVNCFEILDPFTECNYFCWTYKRAEKITIINTFLLQTFSKAIALIMGYSSSKCLHFNNIIKVHKILVFAFVLHLNCQSFGLSIWVCASVNLLTNTLLPLCLLVNALLYVQLGLASNLTLGDYLDWRHFWGFHHLLG
jgi:hypothetical protein